MIHVRWLHALSRVPVQDNVATGYELASAYLCAPAGLPYSTTEAQILQFFEGFQVSSRLNVLLIFNHATLETGNHQSCAVIRAVLSSSRTIHALGFSSFFPDLPNTAQLYLSNQALPEAAA